MTGMSKELDVRELVGRRLQELRREEGLSQAQLAERLQPPMSKRYLSAVERGEKSPTLDSLARIALGLGVSLRDLMPDGPRPAQEPNQARRLGERVSSLAQDAPESEIRCFETVARAFFASDEPSRPSRFERVGRAFFSSTPRPAKAQPGKKPAPSKAKRKPRAESKKKRPNRD